LKQTDERNAVLRQRRDRSSGQALVETALLLPILLILLLGAIDFGRLFFGWVSLHGTARIAANFASTHPSTLTDPDDQDALVSLIEADVSSFNCDPDVTGNNGADPIRFDDVTLTYTKPDGTSTATPVLGDYATLGMVCDFSPIVPLSDVLFGDPINLGARATFVVREGCVNCPAPAPEPPPPTPEQCRLVPEMETMSVAGARLAWASAGFNAANFHLLAGEETSTVETALVDQVDPLSTCVLPLAIFTSEVDILTAAADTETPGVCATAPNLIGMTVGAARVAWDADFDVANFTPDIADDARRVISQTTTPASDPGVTCLALTAQINVVTGDPWPSPPPPSCKVPSMIDATRAQAAAAWVAPTIPGGFLAENFSPDKGGFTVKSQSLVGGTWVPCSAKITVSASPQQ
jgi:Flp pilus assembly protein TadG